MRLNIAMKLAAAVVVLPALVQGFAVPTVINTSVTIPETQYDANGYFIVPLDGPDGVFLVQTNPNNDTEQILTAVKLFDDAPSDAKNGVKNVNRKRDDLPISSYECGMSRHNHDDFTDATDWFGWMCDNGHEIPPGMPVGRAGILWARTGSSIAYGCSWGWTQPCSSDEYYQFDAYMDEDDKCGQWRSGWVNMKVWGKSYGRQLYGEGICGWKHGEIGGDISK